MKKHLVTFRKSNIKREKITKTKTYFIKLLY